MFPLDIYYHELEEPIQSIFLFYRKVILESDSQIVEHWKYKTPFFISYKKKWFCYLSFSKKENFSYIGFIKGNKIEHHLLKAEGRKLIKILKINPNEEIPLQSLFEIITLAKKPYV